MSHFTRRKLLKSGLAAGVVAAGTAPFGFKGAGFLTSLTGKQSATDWITLGKSNVNVTRLAFGTGSFSGKVQRDLGQDGFTRLVRYAYDQGIRFFETAESYGEMQRMLGVALKGIPRDSYRLMSKVTTRQGVDPQEKFDELRKLANTEYFDIMLLHWQHTATWPADTRGWQDGILEAESKRVIVSHGASVHGLPALRQVPGNKWLDLAMIRMNHKGTKMDGEDYNTDGLGDVREVVTHVKQVLAVERALSRQLHADYAHPLCADLFDVRDNLAYVTQPVCVVILAFHLRALMVHPDHGEVEPLVSRYLAQCRKTVNRRAVAYDNPLRLSFQNSILPPARVCWPSRGMLPVQQHYVEVLRIRQFTQLVEFLLRIHALPGGHLRHKPIAVAWNALQGDSEHPVHLAVRLSRLKEANALVVGVTHQPGKSVLSQIALYLAAEAACAKGEAGHFHS